MKKLILTIIVALLCGTFSCFGMEVDATEKMDAEEKYECEKLPFYIIFVDMAMYQLNRHLEANKTDRKTDLWQMQLAEYYGASKWALNVAVSDNYKFFQTQGKEALHVHKCVLEKLKQYPLLLKKQEKHFPVYKNSPRGDQQLCIITQVINILRPHEEITPIYSAHKQGQIDAIYEDIARDIMLFLSKITGFMNVSAEKLPAHKITQGYGACKFFIDMALYISFNLKEKVLQADFLKSLINTLDFLVAVQDKSPIYSELKGDVQLRELYIRLKNLAESWGFDREEDKFNNLKSNELFK